MIIVCKDCGQKNRIPAAKTDKQGKCGKCEASIRATGSPHAVSDEALGALIAHSPLPVLIDFWAEWCGPCRMVAPQLEQLAASRDDVVVVKLNTERYPQVAAREGVRGIPMFALYKDGKRQATTSGYQTAQALEAALGI